MPHDYVDLTKPLGHKSAANSTPSSAIEWDINISVQRGTYSAPKHNIQQLDEKSTSIADVTREASAGALMLWRTRSSPSHFTRWACRVNAPLEDPHRPSAEIEWQRKIFGELKPLARSRNKKKRTDIYPKYAFVFSHKELSQRQAGRGIVSGVKFY